MAESAPIHPVAPRLKEGHKKTHVGPNIDAYKAVHAQTIGPESDKWWAKVCLNWREQEGLVLKSCRWPVKCFIGIAHFTPFGRAHSQQAT
jgi:hypothetical protein